MHVEGEEAGAHQAHRARAVVPERHDQAGARRRAPRGEALRTIGRLGAPAANRSHGIDVAEHGEGAGVGAPGGQEEGAEEGGESAHIRGGGFLGREGAVRGRQS